MIFFKAVVFSIIPSRKQEFSVYEGIYACDVNVRIIRAQVVDSYQSHW